MTKEESTTETKLEKENKKMTAAERYNKGKRLLDILTAARKVHKLYGYYYIRVGENPYEVQDEAARDAVFYFSNWAELPTEYNRARWRSLYLLPVDSEYTAYIDAPFYTYKGKLSKTGGRIVMPRTYAAPRVRVYNNNTGERLTKYQARRMMKEAAEELEEDQRNEDENDYKDSMAEKEYYFNSVGYGGREL